MRFLLRQWTKLLFVILVIPFMHAQADNIVIAGDSWCPFNCEPKAANPGYMVEVAQSILTKAGHTVVYQVMPWERAVQDCRTGKITGVLGAYLDDAPDFVFPKTEQGLIGDGIFILKENPWTYTGISSLSGISLGAIKGYAYGSDELNNYIKTGGKGVQLVFGDKALELNIKKLLEGGRIDAIIETPAVFWYKVNSMNVKDRFKSAGEVSKSKKIYIALSPVNPKSKEYAQLLSDGMDAMRKSGELNTILKKYPYPFI